LTPNEFWGLTPAEFIPFITAKIEWRNKEMHTENERVGLICSTIANVFRGSKSKTYKPSDFVNLGESAKPKKSNPQRIYDKMKMWCTATGGK